MATNPSWPLTSVQVAFNAGLNTAGTPTWTDLTPRLWSMGCDRGRQYELDQVQAGVGGLVFADSDELLNPANTASPYSPNVLPYRQICVQAMWPPAPVGSAVNLLNATAGYDPAFESTAVGAKPPNLLTVSTSPTVQAANPWQGTKSLQWAVAGNSSAQYAGFTITCIPGQQYTASVYVRQTAANTTLIFVPGIANGPSTTATGTYVRLVQTFVATQPTHQLYVGSVTPTLASTVNLDAIQLEPGASASTFTTTGPVIYGVHRGYVERWPSKWNHQGLYGYAEITTVDGFAALAAKKLHTEYRNTLLAKKPDLWWPLSEPQGATAFAEASGNNGPPLLRQDVPGTGSYPPFSPGTAMTIAGDPGSTGLSIATPNNNTSYGQALSIAQTGTWGAPPLTTIGAANAPLGLSMAFWCAWQPISAGGPLRYAFAILMDQQLNNRFTLELNPDNSFQAYSGWSDNSDNVFSAPGAAYADGKPHLLVLTTDWGTTADNVRLYVDGALVGSNLNHSTSGYVPPFRFPIIQVGGIADPRYPSSAVNVSGVPSGIFGHIAIWNRTLSAQDVTDLWTAGQGYAGETSGQRIARYVAANYNGAVGIDAGQSTMAVSDLAEGTILLDACQAVTTSENGNLWVDGNGVLQFAARTRRYYATTSQATFGEQENPYEDDIAFDFDPTLIYNDVSVEQTGGTNAASSDVTSQTSYGPRSYQRQVNIASANEAIDAANWILNTHKDPHQRIATLTIRPSHNPALWPVALGAEVGQRVTVKRRTTAGLTMSSDYFIEQISHDQKPDEWTVSFQMSPAIGYQVGLFDDATYGRFDSTLIFGY